jgi:hypothetical protein
MTVKQLALRKGGDASGGLATCRRLDMATMLPTSEVPLAVERGTSSRLDRQSAQVAETALRLDNTARARIGLELAPQPQDLHVDAPVEHILVHAGRLQKMLAGKRALRRVEEGDKQGITRPSSAGRGHHRGW